MKGEFNRELFELIEARGTVTAIDVADKLGITRRSAATMLSKWTNYTDRMTGKKRHYLVHVSSGSHQPGQYKLGPDWWGERLYRIFQ